MQLTDDFFGKQNPQTIPEIEKVYPKINRDKINRENNSVYQFI